MTHKMWESHIKISDTVLKNSHKWLNHIAKTAIKPIKTKNKHRIEMKTRPEDVKSTT